MPQSGNNTGSVLSVFVLDMHSSLSHPEWQVEHYMTSRETKEMGHTEEQ